MTEETTLTAEQATLALARVVIERLAPQETVIFDEVSDAWLSDPRSFDERRHRRTPGSRGGFGGDAVLLTELAIQMLSGALAEVLGVVTVTAVRRRRHPGRTSPTTADLTTAAPVTAAPATAAPATPGPPDTARGVQAGPSQGRDPDSGPDTDPRSRPTSVPALTHAQVLALRDACVRHAMVLGLIPKEAELLADAAVGAVRLAKNP